MEHSLGLLYQYAAEGRFYMTALCSSWFEMKIRNLELAETFLYSEQIQLWSSVASLAEITNSIPDLTQDLNTSRRPHLLLHEGIGGS